MLIADGKPATMDKACFLKYILAGWYAELEEPKSKLHEFISDIYKMKNKYTRRRFVSTPWQRRKRRLREKRRKLSKRKLYINLAQNNACVKPNVKLKVPVIHLPNLGSAPLVVSPTQGEFLNGLGLRGPDYADEEEVSSESSVKRQFGFIPAKVHTTTGVPLSSPLGQFLLKKEGHNLKETNKIRRVERIDKFVNRAIEYKAPEQVLDPNIPDLPGHLHSYRFMGRQYRGKENFLAYVHNCQPMSVALCNKDLSKEKKSSTKELVINLVKHSRYGLRNKRY